MNSLRGASFPQMAISVCKLCRVGVGSGRKSSELKSSELLEDPGQQD
jgi:predicted metal-binding protein